MMHLLLYVPQSDINKFFMCDGSMHYFFQADKYIPAAAVHQLLLWLPQENISWFSTFNTSYT